MNKIVAFTVGVLLLACGNAPSTVHGGAQCQETASVVGVDEMTPLGFRPRDVTGWVWGSRTAQMQWTKRGYETTIAVGLMPRGGDVRFVKSIDVGTTHPGGRCRSRVEIDADLTVETADGAFKENWMSTLRVERG